ncbi:MAG: DUF169 domain-containing protein [Spirochaetota bacterium]|nr:DUF169 domain-containing protein [Spirochaetota bacterium]
MDNEVKEGMPDFLDVLGLNEEPMGVFYTDVRPIDGFSPEPGDLPTKEKEDRNEIDWMEVFRNFSCIIAKIWKARKRNTAAWFDWERFGCAGGAFFLGYMKPQTETAIHFVSSGIPGVIGGELYVSSPDELRRIFDYIDPIQASARYCVFKPLSMFESNETPELIIFFCRPEVLGGLHQLASFVTNDPEVVQSPWGAGCANLITWPLRYLSNGQNKAVLGGWDPSARRYFKTDELTLTIPYEMLNMMLQNWKTSFLTTHTWQTVRKKIARSKRVWKEE